MDIKVAPSILSADFANLERNVRMLDNAGADYIHIDVMDGNFVPNITIGGGVVKAIRGATDKLFDVHLMINNPQNYIDHFADAGADIITIHSESCTHLQKALSHIRILGKKSGLALVPTTNERKLEYLLEDIDMVVVMCVNPGFGGQKFLTSQLKKIENIRRMIDNSGCRVEIEVDGGINADTARLAVNAGANVLVSGSYLFNGETKDKINNLKYCYE